jgi:oligosaccharide translocation protein RFT1
MPSLVPRDASLLVVLQIFCRIITFSMNIWVVKNVSPAEFGTANVRLYLLYSLIVSLSREGVRRTCLRQQSGSLYHLSLIPFALGVMLTSCMLAYVLMTEPDAHTSTALVITAGGALIELLWEPYYNENMRAGNIARRAKIEALAVLGRSLTTALLVHPAVALSLWAFAAGHVAHGLLLGLGYWLIPPPPPAAAAAAAVSSSRKEGLPTSAIPWSLLGVLTWQFTQSHILAESENVVLLWVTTASMLEDQGIFALAANLGALTARLLFQPMEEVGYACLVRKDADSNRSFLQLWTYAMRFGLFFAVFGPFYAPWVLRILYGSSWGILAGGYLRLWSVYIALLSLNGLSEAYVMGTASTSFLKQHNMFLLFLGVGGILTSSMLITYWKDTFYILMWTSIVSMGSRAIFNLIYIKQMSTLALRPILLPSNTVCAITAMIIAINCCTILYFPSESLLPVLIGASQALLFLYALSTMDGLHIPGWSRIFPDRRKTKSE